MEGMDAEDPRKGEEELDGIGVCGLAEEGCKDITSTADDDDKIPI